jgi:hypothetical protein
MKKLVTLALILSVAVVAGCGSKSAAPQTTGASGSVQPAQTSQPQSAPATAQKSATPVVITPDPGSLDAAVDPKGGISKEQALVAGAKGLIALRQKRLGAQYGASTEEFTLYNEVKVRDEWLLTYMRATIDGKASTNAYASTIVISAKTGKQTRFTEAP